MEKFNKFAENLMKVILVPDETSDAVAPVQAQEEPQDMFSKEVSNYIDNEDNGCGCEHNMEEPSEEPHEEQTGVENVQVTHDTDGLKVQFNGMVLTLPNEVVEKIKEVLNGSITGTEETEHEQQETPEEEHEEHETPEEEHEEQETESEEENEEEEEG